MAELVLVLGGVRSGKSATAEALLAEAAHIRYVATGEAGDAETAARIAAHRARRPSAWETVETRDLAAAVRTAPVGSGVLIDALGPWVLARMDAVSSEALLAEIDALCQAAAAHPGGPVVVVAEAAGLGVVPTGALTRRWLDLLGEASQRLAAAATRALLVVAGRVVALPVARGPSLPDEAGRAYPVRAHGDTMVPPGALDFAVNVHGDGPPPHVRAVLDAALERAGRYPDDAEARAAVAERHRRSASEALVTAGATEAFHLLARVIRARHAVIVQPSFTEPEAELHAAGIPVRAALRRAEDGWRLDPCAVEPAADLVVLGNPNNPTGGLDDPEQVAALCRPGRITLVDEAFMDFVEQPDASLAARRDLPGLVVVRSVTKLWALAGVRAGYLLASPGLIARCAAARPLWATSCLALAAVAACARDDAYRRAVAAQVAADRAELTAALRRLPRLTVYDGAASFLLLRVPDGPAVYAALLERGVAVRPSTFAGLSADHLRVTVRDRRRNRALVDALAAVLDPSEAVAGSAERGGVHPWVWSGEGPAGTPVGDLAGGSEGDACI